MSKIFTNFALEMTPEEAAIFDGVMDYFKAKYPDRRIQYEYEYGDKFVSVDGSIKFNIVGYNLLYCLSLLCNVLEKELL